MANAVRILAPIGILLLLTPWIEPTAYGQTSVFVEVKVLQLSPIELDKLGAVPMRPGFARSLSSDLLESLTNTPRSKTVHRVELQGTSGKSSELRVDSRISVTSSNSREAPSYFEVGIGVDVAPKVFQNRDISLTMASRVRIRRGAASDAVPPVLFETPSLKHEIRIHDGETIVLAGFITEAERMSLPPLPTLPDNPILNYLFPKTREQRNNSEIVVLLTPRINGMVIDPAVDEPPVVVNMPGKPVVIEKPANVTMDFVIDKPAPISTSAPVIAMTAAAAPPAVPVPAPVPVAIAVAAPAPLPVRDAAAAPGAPAVTTPPASVAPKSVRGMYTVQVGAFDNVAKAEALVAQISKTHDGVFIDKLTGKTPFRVRVGRLPDMQSARQLQRQLAREGFDTFMTTLD